MITIKYLLLVFSVLLGYSFGWYFTEKNILADKHPLFKFKAFMCRPCLSFHIAWVTATAISLLFNDWIMVVFGIIMSLLMYWGLKIDEKNKTIKI